MRKFAIRLTAILIISLVFFGMYKEDPTKQSGVAKVTTNDLRNHIDINQMDMIFYNNGLCAYNNAGSGTSGLFWPKGTAHTCIFEDGLVWGGRIGATEIRVGGSTYRAGLQAGPINSDGTAADPSDPRFKIWKIKKGATDSYDYKNWPIDLGAPYTLDKDGNKVPNFIGDEVDWFVMNDLDASRTTFLYGTSPIGIEVQVTIFGFDKTGPLGNMLFKKYKLIHKGTRVVHDMVLGQWSDPDLGDANDDYVGCDTVRSLGYCYNGTNMDGTGSGATYGANPPAVGYDFFQGPVIPYDPANYPIINQRHLPDSAKFLGKWVKGKTNLPLTSYSFYINSGPAQYKDPDLGVPAGAQQLYNYMTSRDYNGDAFVDPTQGNIPVSFCLYGDPVAKTGWYEGVPSWTSAPKPGDRRMMLSSGKFTFSPGDTQEVVVAVIVGRGSSNLNSIQVLKDEDDAAQLAYNLDFNLVPPPPQPKVHYAELDKKLVLYWEDNAESYNAFDPLLGKRGLKDTTYKFQGYQVYQYSDVTLSNPVLLATYDITDSLSTIYDYTTYQNQQVLVPVVTGDNTGIRRTIEITTDAEKNIPLVNGTPYYFGVVSYGYCSSDAPRVLFSTPVIISPTEEPSRGLIPHALAVGDQFTNSVDSYLSISKSSATPNDGVVAAKVVDPNALTGHDYEVFMTGADATLRWNLRDVTTGDTLLKQQLFDTTNIATYTASGFDLTLGAKIIDGFVIRVGSPMGTNAIKEIVMTQDAGKAVTPVGNVAPLIPRSGVNVFGVSTATGGRNWWITSLSVAAGTADLQSLNFNNLIGENDYEIRFDKTNKSSYYSASDFKVKPPLGINNLTYTNPVGKDSVPFTFWNVGNAANPKQLYTKVYDKHGVVAGKDTVGKIDSLWTGNFVNEQRLVYDSLAYEELYFWQDTTSAYKAPVPGVLSPKAKLTDYPIGRFTICSHTTTDFPADGTVLRINTWKKVKPSDKFTFTAVKPKKSDLTVGKTSLDRISVYPNPYLGAHSLEIDKYQRFVRFNNLPNNATIRIYTVAGVFVRRLEKSDTYKTYLDWDLKNKDGLPVASGMFVAYVEIPGMGTKVLKLAVIQETPYIDRL
jgi:hypothetical protein